MVKNFCRFSFIKSFSSHDICLSKKKKILIFYHFITEVPFTIYIVTQELLEVNQVNYTMNLQQTEDQDTVFPIVFIWMGTYPLSIVGMLQDRRNQRAIDRVKLAWRNSRKCSRSFIKRFKKNCHKKCHKVLIVESHVGLCPEWMQHIKENLTLEILENYFIDLKICQAWDYSR